MRAGRLTKRIALAAVTLVLAVASAEGIGRRLWPRPDPGPGIVEGCGDCPYLFQLPGTARSEIARDGGSAEWATPAAGSEPRILVLGDSVIHGMDLDPASRVTERLERRLRPRWPGVEVINAGVPGYSTYNELAWYRARGRGMGADLVVLGVCLNDVVDPLLHWTHLEHRPWSEIREVERSIPIAAVPDPDYHRRHVLDPLRRQRVRLWLADHSALLRRFGAVGGWAGPLGGVERPHSRSVSVDGRAWPVQLTAEDELPITVWTDADSPQWAWFRSTIEDLQAATSEDGTRLALVVFPLAYQLDPQYPYLPQERMASHALSSDLAFLDLLPALRAADAPFVEGDDWHLSAEGHAVAAAALESFVESLLPGEPTASGQSSSTRTGIRSEE